LGGLCYRIESANAKPDIVCYRIESANAKPDIVCLQETLLDSDKHTNACISISGNTLFRKDRKLGKHEGVAVYVKST
jgi:exonuclease III